VVLQPKRELRSASTQTLRIKEGLRGEGPRKSHTLYHTFVTYSPLRVDYTRCSHYRCAPKNGFYMRFNNPLISGPEALAKLLTIRYADGPKKGQAVALEAWSAGHYVNLRASLEAQTRYTITADKSIIDIHDQTLGSSYSATLKTGDLAPQLSFPVKGMAAIERSGSRLVPLEVKNVQTARMRLVKVAPEDIHKLIQLTRYSWYRKNRDPLEGIKNIKIRRTLNTRIGRNKEGWVGISTDEVLGKGAGGAVFVELLAMKLRQNGWYNPYRNILVQVTDMAMMVRYDNDRIVGLLSHMQTGNPIAGASLILRDRKGAVVWRGKSDKAGMIRAPGRRALKKTNHAPLSLWAKKAGDSAFLILGYQGDDGGYLSSYGWGSVPKKRRLHMHLFSDRSPYRPGQKVHLKGILRVVAHIPSGGVEALPPTVDKVSYRIVSSRSRELQKGEATVSKAGAFNVDVTLPPDADVGRYRVIVKPKAGPYQNNLSGSFSVEEYRAPEFKVKVETSPGPYFVGQTLSAKVGADYLFGAPMSGAKVSWVLSRKQSQFTPPNNPGFRFGELMVWRSSWRYSGRRRRYRGGLGLNVWRKNSASGGPIAASGKGLLEHDGRLGLEVKLSPDKEQEKAEYQRTLAFTLEATVTDKNRQTISNRKTVVVHPANVYVGLKSNKSVIKAGQKVAVAAVVADLKGKRQVGHALTIEAWRVVTKVRTVFEKNRWTYKYESKEQRIGSCSVRSADRPQQCEITLPKAGSYQLRAASKDKNGRLTRSAIRVYAYGDGYVPWRLKNQSRIELVADETSYRPGETAKILVKSPLRKGVGLLSYERSGMEHVERVALEGSAQIIEVPIKKHHYPNLHVSIALGHGRLRNLQLSQGKKTNAAMKKAARDFGRPTFAHGTIRLNVVDDSKRISVKVSPDKKTIAPSERFTVKVETKDHQGKPAPTEVALMIVDEGVLSLMGYQTPDPTSVFWVSRGRDAPLKDIRNLLLARKKVKSLKKRALKRRSRRRRARYRRGVRDGTIGLGRLSGIGKGGGGVRAEATARSGLVLLGGKRKARRAPAGSARPAQPAGGPVATDALAENKRAGAAPRIRSRSRFATTAFYAPSVQTDKNGVATISVKMPDNLTTFRIMAVALDTHKVDRFGKGENQITVRKPLLLRPSLPRFLSVGDRFEAAVMVHNETDKAGTVDVLVRGRNARPESSNRQRVEIPAHGKKEVRFAMRVERVGPARIQFAAILDSFTDGVEKQLPVYLPVTTEAFATYGMTAKSVAQPVSPPKNSRDDYGGLDISFSSTALNGLEDAVSYLVDYPHECTEQTASRIIPIFALADILDDFGIGKLKDRKRRKTLARAGVRKLLSYQRYDGGWGYWPGSTRSWLYISAYASIALLEAKAQGEKINSYKLKRAKRFLKHRLDYPSYWERLDWVGQTAAAWVLARQKQYEKRHLDRLYGLHKKLPIFARAWLMQALHLSEGKSARVQELLRQIDNAAVQTSSAARFAEGSTESLRLLMHTNDRSDAIVLGALLQVAPNHSLLPKVARGLLQSRIRGRWSTTQSNGYALMALSRYYKQIEKVVPDFTSQIWYGEGFMGQASFKGRELKSVRQTIPLAALKKLGEQSLLFAKKGPGQLYYRIGLRYAPKDLVLPPRAEGFTVMRRYESLTESSANAKGKTAKTVKQLPNGHWQIKAGATVRVRVTVVVPDRRFFVAIADPLPAGLEPVNFRLKTAARTRLRRRLDHRTHSSWSWYSLSAFDHRDIRDERVVFYANRMPAGVYEYTYLARATTYGDFVAGPSKAEEMYRPETFGRSGTTRVIIK
jgi:uncharacterized protein YfaS (alpha-2-macroglobulin family)